MNDFTRNSKPREHSSSPNSIYNKRSRTNSRNRRDTERSHDSDSNLSNPQEVVPIVQNGLGAPNMWNQMLGMGYPMVGMNMLMDPNVMSMNNFGILPPMLSANDPNIIQAPDTSAALMNINPVKEIIHCKSCTLFPPNPNAPVPTTRERPPGCRTVFVGGLPVNMTEAIISEIFERCGEITTLRLSKKNFCHIRFVYEASVDAAIFLSGYRVRIGSNADTANTGRLHIDYAQARDDQYEWECRQRQLQREQRHRERMEEERLRPPSPPPVVHYTDHEAAAVSEKIKQDDTFAKAVQIVITWLERGDCSKRNANNFYSMIQSTNSHVRRLISEKTQYEDELKKARDLLKGRMQGILLQFGQIERLFVAACHKKVWDHFTKPQRKNIEMWKKQSLEIKNVQCIDDIWIEKQRDDDEMEVSDDENESPTKKKFRSDALTYDEHLDSIREENESLTRQIEAYKNEVEVLKIDYNNALEEKDKQFKLLQQTLQGMQQQLLEAKKKQVEEENKVKELLKNNTNIDNSSIDNDESELSTVNETLNAKLVGIISAFLNVHPFGANLDYIWSYVSKIESNIRPVDIENLMNRFPNVFKQELVGIGANIERKWIFNAFTNSI